MISAYTPYQRFDLDLNTSSPRMDSCVKVSHFTIYFLFILFLDFVNVILCSLGAFMSIHLFLSAFFPLFCGVSFFLFFLIPWGFDSHTLCRIELILNSIHDRLQQQVYSWPDTIYHHRDAFDQMRQISLVMLDHLTPVQCHSFLKVLLFSEILGVSGCVWRDSIEKWVTPQSGRKSETEEALTSHDVYWAFTRNDLSCWGKWWSKKCYCSSISHRHCLSVNLTFLWKCFGTFSPLLKPIYGIVCDYSLYQWCRLFVNDPNTSVWMTQIQAVILNTNIRNTYIL